MGGRSHLKQFLTLNIALSLILGLAWAAWGAEAFTFKNVSIETLGNQRYDLDTNTITIADHVRITVDDTIIEADSLIYYGNQNQIAAGGNVRMMKSAQITLTADRLELDMNTDWLEASGAVQFVSPNENYRSETIRYNLRQMTGSIGPLQGVIPGWPKDFYLTGEEAEMNEGATIISSAGLTRCPRRDGRPDYVFAARRMVVKGEDIYMERVVLKIFGIPVLYLPRMVLQGEAAPRIDLSANQGEEIDLSKLVAKNEQSAAPKGKTQPIQGNGADSTRAGGTEEEPVVPGRRREAVQVSPQFEISIYPVDKPSVITVGRIYSWGRHSDEVDLNYDSRGTFSLSDTYQTDWEKYNLTIDGKSDLADQPQQELGMAFTKKAWKTSYGNWQIGVTARWLYSRKADGVYEGIYGGYRLDYQLNPDLNLSYLYLSDISGAKHHWELLERDFLVINNYRLGGNCIYSLNIPLSPHYFIVNRGYYSLGNYSWTSQATLFVREVGSLRMGFGWDFAKNLLNLTFKLSL